MEQIKKIILESSGYGYRRVTKGLRGRLIIVNHKRVLLLMRGEKPTFRKSRFRLIKTESEHGNPVYPNLIRWMEITSFKQAWGADFTYVQFRNKYIYLAVEMDIYGKNGTFWSLRKKTEY